MAPIYSQAAINGRLNGLVTAIGASGAGFLKLFSGPTILSTIQLALPCGTVSGGVLTFTGSLIDPSAAGTGLATNGIVTDALGNTMISGLTVGIPGATADIILSNGQSTTQINAGQGIQLLAAQIVGS